MYWVIFRDRKKDPLIMSRSKSHLPLLPLSGTVVQLPGGTALVDPETVTCPAVRMSGTCFSRPERKHADVASRKPPYRVDAGRRVHILDGDLTGGGHRAGTGKGKSEFPQDWSDDDVIRAIEDVANDLNSVRVPGRKGRTVAKGVRRGIPIRVVVDEVSGLVVTGYPEYRRNGTS